MPLKKSVGNNYDWITHSHAHLGGECPHKCVYCYVDNPRFGRHPKYQGELRLIEKEFDVKYGEGKQIFVENCNDLFAMKVPAVFIYRILQHCREWQNNTYIFQTKNPSKMIDYIDYMPESVILLTTLETNRDTSLIGNAPSIKERVQAMVKLHERIKTL